MVTTFGKPEQDPQHFSPSSNYPCLKLYCGNPQEDMELGGGLFRLERYEVYYFWRTTTLHSTGNGYCLHGVAPLPDGKRGSASTMGALCSGMGKAVFLPLVNEVAYQTGWNADVFSLSC